MVGPLSGFIQIVSELDNKASYSIVWRRNQSDTTKVDVAVLLQTDPSFTQVVYNPRTDVEGNTLASVSAFLAAFPNAIEIRDT